MYHYDTSMNPIVEEWQHGEPVTDPVRPNNNGGMLGFILFYYAERRIKLLIPILYVGQNSIQKRRVNGGNDVTDAVSDDALCAGVFHLSSGSSSRSSYDY